jgi:predicted TIM-barrel fold metal-dependent hydrolase
MHQKGVNLIGELVPYSTGYTQYNTENLNKIIDYASAKGMVVNLHTMPDDDDLDAFVEAYPNVTIIGAHPGENPKLIRHIERLKKYPNYYLDVSGTGIFRHGSVRKLIDEVGAERIIFGSDYPTCNPSMFVGAILLDELITPEEKQLIFSENAKRILKI